jgi:uncharacterized protein (DUF2267 family)
MSATGLDVFDKTLQLTNIWLDDIMEAIGPDRQVAWHVLRTVLHGLRDRMPVETAAHLGAELPLLVRGAYYDEFVPARQPTRWRSLEEFTEVVAEGLRDTRPVHPRLATDAVFATLSRRIPSGQIRKVQDVLPHAVREAWIAIEEAVVPPPEPQTRASELGTDELFAEDEGDIPPPAERSGDANRPHR